MRRKDDKKPATNQIAHSCGWSRMLSEGDNPDEALRYHLIQVHNDQDAVRKGRF